MAPFLLSSCLATPSLPRPSSHPLNPTAALLEHPSAESRLILESAIGFLLNSQPIKLADNVFLHKSTVIIERRQTQDNRGNLLDGRAVRPADTVILLTEQGKCYLQHEQNGNTTLLDSSISCKAK